MRFKVLSLFLAIQLASFALWQGTQAWGQNSEEKPIVVEASDAVATPSHQAAKPRVNQIRFSATDDRENYQTLNDEQKNELMAVISKLPAEHTSTLRNLVLDLNPSAHRGLGGRSIIILRGVNMGQTEEAAVLIHEVGHIVDLGNMAETDQTNPSEFKDGKSPVFKTDPSLGFYRLSWADESAKLKTAGDFDFVSGYAKTDPFEDFAESYVYYVLHNQDFKAKAQTSETLLKKYEFMRDSVFGGKVFGTGEYKPESLNQRPWDVTVLNYDLEGFLMG